MDAKKTVTDGPKSTATIDLREEGRGLNISGEQAGHTLYEENAKVTAIFWEWRHKLMTQFFTGIAALFALAGWFYQQETLRPWLFTPFLIGAAFSLITLYLDKRNTIILRRCYKLGEEIESSLCEGGAIFTFINQIHYLKGSYTQVLHKLYGLSALLLAVLSCLLFASFAIR